MIDRNHPKYKALTKYSDPALVEKFGKDYGVGVLISSRRDKKYTVRTGSGKLVHFGGWGQEDYTRHKDKKRRENYLKRSAGVKGDWKRGRCSPNNLPRSLLW